jgi:ribosomal protein L7/L12
MPNLSDNQYQSIITTSRSGNLIEAIRLYRQYTGAGLAEAKAAVEQLMAENVVSSVAEPGLTNDQLQSVLAALREKGKIQAIKLYRDYTGADLADAKSAVELMAANGQLIASEADAPAKKGCGASAMVFVVISMVIYFLARR